MSKFTLKEFYEIDPCGLYYKPMTMVNDDSRVVEATLTDDAGVVRHLRSSHVYSTSHWFDQGGTPLAKWLSHWIMNQEVSESKKVAANRTVSKSKVWKPRFHCELKSLELNIDFFSVRRSQFREIPLIGFGSVRFGLKLKTMRFVPLTIHNFFFLMKAESFWISTSYESRRLHSSFSSHTVTLTVMPVTSGVRLWCRLWLMWHWLWRL